MRRTVDTIDPQVQAIFDAMIAYMVTGGLPSCNASVTQTGSGINESISGTHANGDSFTYTYFVQGTRVTITPVTVSLGPGATQQFTASAVDSDGVPVPSPTFTWSIVSGLGTLGTDGLYTAPASIAAASNVTIRAVLSTGVAWSQITIAIHP